MNKNYIHACLKLALLVAVALCGVRSDAQLLRTSYFMDGSHYRLQLNPALAPSRGFIHLPVVSNIGASYWSNTLGSNDLADIIDNKASATYFASDKFFNNLEDNNQAMLNVGTDLMAVGWWHGESFWSLNVGLKVNGDISAPRSMFSFLRDMKGMNPVDYSNYVSDVTGEEINLNAYTEFGVGWARQYGNFSAGLRIKALMGLGNVNFKVNRVLVKTNFQGVDPYTDWGDVDYEAMADVTGTASVEVDAELETSFEGLKFPVNEDGYIDDVRFESGRMGAAGVGAGFDAGLAWRVAGGFTLSAAVVDLGFIKWSKKASQIARSSSTAMTFDTDSPEGVADFADIVSSGKVINPNLLRLHPEGKAEKARTTNLDPTMVVGAEYAFMNDRLRLGALYSNHFAQIKNKSEVTLSVNYSPSSLVDLTASYSPVLCGGKSFGFAVKVGPLFVGSDYVYLGKDSKCANALFGLSIPLGKKKPEEPLPNM